LPQAFRFLDAYQQKIAPLAGHTPTSDRSVLAMVVLNRGVA